MNPKLRQLRGSDAVRALERGGFVVTRIKGSHHILVYPADRSRRATVPVHAGQSLKPGTMRSILAQAKLTEDEFVQLL
jgi:predicted RNA binding protein YcfA (HicA-like mRNA interferase family)